MAGGQHHYSYPAMIDSICFDPDKNYWKRHHREENMPRIVEREEFIRTARTYVSQLLSGICEDKAYLAADSQPQTVRIVAKLSNADFQAIKFSDLYISVQKVVGRLGQRHLDPITNLPHTAEFKLYDPYFETLTFEPI